MDSILFWIGQGLGIVAILLGFLSFQMRTQKQLLFMQTATSIVFCLHYLLIGAFSGMALNIICIFRNIVYHFRNKGRRDQNYNQDSDQDNTQTKNLNKQELFIPLAFVVIMGIAGLFTWDAWYSVFAVCGMMINTFCMSLPDPQSVRKSILISSPLVLTYDLFALSYGGVIYETVAIISSIVGIQRHRKI